MTDKQEQQLKMLAQWAENIEKSIQASCRSLKSFSLDTESHEKVLRECLTIFSSGTIPSKKDLSKAMSIWDGEVGLMMCRWMEAFLDGPQIDVQYLEDIDPAQLRRMQAYSKELNHLQSRGSVGFDDVKHVRG